MIKSKAFRDILNSRWLFYEYGLRLISGVFIGSAVAKLLGPIDFGYLNLAISVAVISQSIAKLGIENVLLKELKENSLDTQELISITNAIRFLISFVLVIIGLVIIYTTQKELSQKVMLSIAMLFSFSSLNDTNEQRFLAEHKAKELSFRKIYVLLTISALKLLLVFFSMKAVFFIGLMLVEAVISFYLYSKFYGRFRILLRFSPNQMMRFSSLIRQSLPLFLSSFSFLLLMRLDLFMIEHLLDPFSVGVYSAAVRISELSFAVPTIAISVVYSNMISQKMKGLKAYNEYTVNLYSILFWISVILGLLISGISTTIVSVLFGPDFGQAADVISIQVLTTPFVALTVISGRQLIINGQSKLILYRSVLGLIGNFVANLFLIPKFGLLGAAYGTLISWVIISMIFDVFMKSTRNIMRQKMKGILLWNIMN